MITLGGGGSVGFFDDDLEEAAAAWAGAAVLAEGCLDAMVEAGRGRDGRADVVGAADVRA